jgi:hypothetical protein
MSLRATMLESFCTARRAKISRDPASGVLQDFFGPAATVLFTNKPCSVQHQSETVADLYGQRNTFVRTMVQFDQDPGCEVNDLLIIWDRTSYDVRGLPIQGKGVNYLVQGPAQPVGRGRTWWLEVVLVRSP